MQRRIYGRLTKSAKKEAEDWARQTKRTLGKILVCCLSRDDDKCSLSVMELIKQRKHTWISSLDKRMRQVRGGELRAQSWLAVLLRD